jgi:hypothetical protein
VFDTWDFDAFAGVREHLIYEYPDALEVYLSFPFFGVRILDSFLYTMMHAEFGRGFDRKAS